MVDVEEVVDHDVEDVVEDEEGAGVAGGRVVEGGGRGSSRAQGKWRRRRWSRPQGMLKR